jgi:twinkle protein
MELDNGINLDLIRQHLDAGRAKFKTPCPACAASRKKPGDLCLSWLHEENRAVFNCHHCATKGVIFLDGEQYFSSSSAPLPAQRPDFKAKLLPLDLEVMGRFVRERGISPSVQACGGVFGFQRNGMAWVGFPYRDLDGRVTGLKYRGLDEKKFWQEAGGLQTFYLLSRVDPSHALVITEGEIDALSMLEAGVQNAVSVPGGAPSAEVSDSSSKFDFLHHSKLMIDKVPKVILAVDNDAPGKILEAELARRIGRSKCWTVEYPEGCKDANDVLMKHGREVLQRVVLSAKPMPVSGVYTIDDFSDEYWKFFHEGHGSGESTGWNSVDELFSIVPGQLSVVTGTPGSGKSSVLDQVFVHLARTAQWTFGLCSFENDRHVHAGHLAELWIGKRFMPGHGQMLEEEAERARYFLRNHFHFVSFQDSDESPTIDWILDKARALVLRYGIRGLLIDPYNYIQGISTDHEHRAISDLLTKLRMFAGTYQVHVWIVAHPTKLLRTKEGDIQIPRGNEISGGAAWWAKADIGITINRVENRTQVWTWKVRYRWLGREGMTELLYDPTNGSYNEPSGMETSNGYEDIFK